MPSPLPNGRLCGFATLEPGQHLKLGAAWHVVCRVFARLALVPAWLSMICANESSQRLIAIGGTAMVTGEIKNLASQNDAGLQTWHAVEDAFFWTGSAHGLGDRVVIRQVECPWRHCDFASAQGLGDGGLAVALGTIDGEAILPIGLVRLGCVASLHEAFSRDESPSRVVQRINEGVYGFNRRASGPQLTSRLVVGRTDGRVFRFCNAGLSEFFAVNSLLEVVQLGVPGPKLGHDAALQWAEQAIDLDYAHRLIVLSAGCLESIRPVDVPFLLRRLHSDGLQPLPELAEALSRELGASASGETAFRRDATFLLADLRADASRPALDSLNLRMQRYEADSGGELDSSVFLG